MNRNSRDVLTCTETLCPKPTLVLDLPRIAHGRHTRKYVRARFEISDPGMVSRSSSSDAQLSHSVGNDPDGSEDRWTLRRRISANPPALSERKSLTALWYSVASPGARDLMSTHARHWPIGSQLGRKNVLNH